MAHETQGYLCRPALEAAASGFDLIFANVLGLGEWGNRTKFDGPARWALDLFQRSVKASAGKQGFVMLESTAQHFLAANGTGLYSDAQREAIERRGLEVGRTCYCRNIQNIPLARSRVWQNVKMHKFLHELPGHGAELPALRLWNMTAPMWDMHIARTQPEHNREAGKEICDCTHFCYRPSYWRSVFFPAMQRAIMETPFGKKLRSEVPKREKVPPWVVENWGANDVGRGGGGLDGHLDW